MQLLEIEALRNRVLEFVGVAGQIDGIETQDIGEIIYAGYELIMRFRLDGMA